MNAIEKVQKALDEIRAGRMVILVDDEDRENEGDLVFAAELVTPELINFMATHARGLICLAMDDAMIDKLELQPMVRDNQASLTIMHAYVIPSYPLPEGYVLASSETVAEILTKTQQAMNEARSRALAAGVTQVDIVMSEGAPFSEIIRAAREHDSDLIVIATHGRTGIKHALLGSVTEKVVRKAPCAVLTVRDPEQDFVRP